MIADNVRRRRAAAGLSHAELAVLAGTAKSTIADSKADCRYIVIPERPAGTDAWNEDQLATIVTRNALIGTAIVENPPS